MKVYECRDAKTITLICDAYNSNKIENNCIS